MKRVCACAYQKPENKFKSKGGISTMEQGEDFCEWWEKRPESEIWQARVGMVNVLWKIYGKISDNPFYQIIKIKR